VKVKKVTVKFFEVSLQVSDKCSEITSSIVGEVISERFIILLEELYKVLYFVTNFCCDERVKTRNTSPSIRQSQV